MDSNNATSGKLDVYQIVTDRIIELLEQGTVPWQKPWTDAGMPANLLSKRPYRGVNFWLLFSLNYERNLFLTWDQLKKIGGSVNQGEHGHVVIYWKKPVKREGASEDERDKKPPILRYYKVFNIAQCRDLPEDLVGPIETMERYPLLECEAVVSGMPQSPVIKHKQQEAFYQVGEDYINMPRKKSFKSPESYYTTLFHELIHSTGHQSRLDRKTISEMSEFGSEKYSLEELVAELGSAYLSSFTGILPKEIDNTVSYISGWLGKLRNDKRFIVQASGQAQRAVDYILNQPLAESERKEEVAEAI